MFRRPMEDRAPVVCRLRSLVKEILGQRLLQLTSFKGGYGYDPIGLFLVLMFGYMQGTRSSRKLQELCRFDCRYEYLSDGVEPDHVTICAFRRSLETELEELFVLACQEAERRGILERRCMAVDGTKVQAVRSQWKRALKEAEAVDDLEDEARTMVSHGEFLIGYNLQVAADTGSGMIVGYVASNQENDFGQLEAVLPAVERQSGGLSEAAIFDRGYDSSQNAQAAAEHEVQAYLPPIEKKGPRPPFRTDEEGRVTCPAGHAATRMSKTSPLGKPRQLYRVYRCNTCPTKPECGIKGNRRDYTLAQGADPKNRQEANARATSPEGHDLLRLRGPTIERVFGQFKGNQGFRRLLLRGVSGAAVELGLMSLGYNLNILLS